ncbi:MAG: nitroreductase family protein [Minisyncoccales bacterium]
MQLNNAVKKRRSVKVYKDKKPDWRDIIECIDNVRYTPMAGNVFSLKFVLVDNSEKIKKIADACQQDFISKAYYVVVFCSVPDYTTSLYDERGKKYLKQQAGAGIQNFLLSIVDKGLSSCWVGHFNDKLIKEILSIPESVDVEAICPIGYETSVRWKKENKAKSDLNSCLFFNGYGEKKMKKPKKLEV